jgi:hypothetical protein
MTSEWRATFNHNFAAFNVFSSATFFQYTVPFIGESRVVEKIKADLYFIPHDRRDGELTSDTKYNIKFGEKGKHLRALHA